MIWLGIDPGKSGAMVAIMPDSDLLFCKLNETEHDVSNWLSDLSRNNRSEEIRGTLEEVSAMPKQGVSSTFKFGQSYGFCRGLLVAENVAFETVRPAKWQKLLGCRSGGDKNVTKAKAQELFPWHRWTHATADAVLLAEYGRRTYAK